MGVGGEFHGMLKYLPKGLAYAQTEINVIVATH